MKIEVWIWRRVRRGRWDWKEENEGINYKVIILKLKIKNIYFLYILMGILW